MAKFIPIDKITKLRESAKNGDERALHILDMQLNDEDFGQDLDDYFCPHQENHDPIKSDKANASVDSMDAMEKAKQMPDTVSTDNQTTEPGFGVNVLQRVYELSSEIDKATMEIVQNDKLTDAVRKGALESLNDLKKQAIAAVSALRSLRKEIEKKEENNLSLPQNIVK